MPGKRNLKAMKEKELGNVYGTYKVVDVVEMEVKGKVKTMFYIVCECCHGRYATPQRTRRGLKCGCDGKTREDAWQAREEEMQVELIEKVDELKRRKKQRLEAEKNKPREMMRITL